MYSEIEQNSPTVTGTTVVLSITNKENQSEVQRKDFDFSAQYGRIFNLKGQKFPQNGNSKFQLALIFGRGCGLTNSFNFIFKQNNQVNFSVLNFRVGQIHIQRKVEQPSEFQYFEFQSWSNPHSAQSRYPRPGDAKPPLTQATALSMLHPKALLSPPLFPKAGGDSAPASGLKLGVQASQRPGAG
ncbi:hypothetical protein UY3_10161 [Chelonia mydas]|uniref:Uncharacterized protein n=1 Tax=Chelonia mydas TaxID=8469 RepID=M7B471_CHEMY|nr:hypothetical protein UY3_10161 [Chelonia mydas]